MLSGRTWFLCLSFATGLRRIWKDGFMELMSTGQNIILEEFQCPILQKLIITDMMVGQWGRECRQDICGICQNIGALKPMLGLELTTPPTTNIFSQRSEEHTSE